MSTATAASEAQKPTPFPSEAKPGPKLEIAAPAPAAPAFRRRRPWLRIVLLILIPALALAGGGWLWLSGGRYVGTDNAYVAAQKVLITPDVSGKVVSIAVKEGQRVAVGDELLRIDPEPYRIALEQAQAKVAGVETAFANLKATLESADRQIENARQTLSLRQSDAQRKADLLANRTGSRTDAELSEIAVTAARAQLESLEQARNATLNQLRGRADLPIAEYPPYMEAQAALSRATLDLDRATLRAPIAGVATQVSSIQMGRYLPAGTAVFSIVDTQNPWVDANLKETDLTNVKRGQKVTLSIDTFPGRVFHGQVAAISPGTGAQFSILPAQNASGNWVKVVQRVPVRIEFDPSQDVSELRAGMSTTVDIDTRRERSLAGLFGLSATAHGQ
ncbi:HlyD family secretion protein [Alsobacter sp. SYSU M60028]|uniref:HlyD family secretion protein n=1 Tax=Alsobacter ponti TaxID=2962936 RepID=A0ABT1L9D0_9HYPH|nr:HlyD family secretion protein [Alsobacter ponti]MCP8937553.1 HlyD family secretion protein [Alsobacter ponti]